MNEQEKRSKRFNKKMKRAGLLILIGFASIFAAAFVPAAMLNAGCSERLATLTNLVFRGIYSFGVIIGVLMFAKALHDPLTKKEAEELAEKEKLEKTGR